MVPRLLVNWPTLMEYSAVTIAANVPPPIALALAPELAAISHLFIR